jgi:7-cyano-7-deazaguanine synthase
MCSVVGALLCSANANQADEINKILSHIWLSSHARGRDGRGYMMHFRGDRLGYFDKSTQRVNTSQCVETDIVPQVPASGMKGVALIGNLRAEPTTEYVKNKRDADQQPYSLNGWSIVHNGTIANDRELRTHGVPTTIDSASIVELLARARPWFTGFVESVRKLRGSFAILAIHNERPGELYVAVNYRPVWFIRTGHGYFFASSRDNFPPAYTPEMVQPYTVTRFAVDQEPLTLQLHAVEHPSRKALVVCSGGLDSVVSATWAQRNGYDVTLVHFLYGSRAEGPELTAIQHIAQELGVPYIMQQVNLYRPGDSPLLDATSKIAGGEAGAEFAFEWVPARNLMMLALATALAEARGIETIVLGNNLEEAGAYPDNEPEFIARFNDILPFAVGDGKRMQVVMPVGNMMKHEIVALGHKLDAPMHLTWSCYRAGERHCGTCGPCFMRRKAFEINGLDEVIHYEN